MTPDALARAVPEITLAEARRIVAAVQRDGHLEAPLRNVRRVALDAARRAGHVPRLELVSRAASRLDPFVKLGFRLAGGQVVETVRIPLEKNGRFSVCVSSQAGCALACAFCATGRLGLERNLETWEIVEQVREVRATLEPGQRVHGVVFQGMGEPLANLDRVLAAIAVFSDSSALAVDSRAITVCTSGLPSGIRRLAREAPRVRLGLSLGSALPDTRRRLMPITDSHPLDEVLAAVVEHARHTGLAPLWAVTLLAGVNDTLEHAAALATLALDFTARAGVRPRLSIIPYNSIDDDPAQDPFRRTDPEREAAFRDALAARGVYSHKRYSGGADVGAACGQLAARAGGSMLPMHPGG